MDEEDQMIIWEQMSFHTARESSSTFFESLSEHSFGSSTSSTGSLAKVDGSRTATEIISGPYAAESWPPARTIKAWSHGVFEDLQVRDIDYSKLKKKVPSLAGLYDVVGIHVLRGDRVDHAIKFVQPPNQVCEAQILASTGTWTSPVPRVLVWNLQLPYETWSPCPGCSMVVWGIATDETLRLAENLETAPASIKLWAEYLKETAKRPESSKTSHILKGIAKSENLQDMALPWILDRTVKSYNGKPVLINEETTKILDSPEHRNTDCTPEWVELSTDGRLFNTMSRKLVSSVLDKSQQARLNAGILIQGVENSELPEQLLMCFRIAHLEL
eukprot:gnl/MRDRNA2_/MRDRNA2_226811_c0_seq1.p1 gnl/MRDRNA2_/MRDRNA2_226811_c0~~gnl/MRDRNA2_/MRDRNA2_226811_c0_seq1.p1  ORF type:complete len:344 (+),score=65.44 gnl/MRDRNA2_/MRDRNA2_226811_c0_seq1:45-1034(+)